MPPHCDSMDGPVVRAAVEALAARDVDLVLPYVPADGEEEVRKAFERVLAARDAGAAARPVADRYLFETVVRVHRAGEGAPFTGLKPAGLDVGPVLPLAEKAVENGVADEVVDFLTNELRDQVKHRIDRVSELTPRKNATVAETRAYVRAMLDFEVYTHHLHQTIRSGGHAHAG